jgi:hypothetical protein
MLTSGYRWRITRGAGCCIQPGESPGAGHRHWGSDEKCRHMCSGSSGLGGFNAKANCSALYHPSIRAKSRGSRHTAPPENLPMGFPRKTLTLFGSESEHGHAGHSRLRGIDFRRELALQDAGVIRMVCAAGAWSESGGRLFCPWRARRPSGQRPREADGVMGFPALWTARGLAQRLRIRGI